MYVCAMAGGLAVGWGRDLQKQARDSFSLALSNLRLVRATSVRLTHKEPHKPTPNQNQSTTHLHQPYTRTTAEAIPPICVAPAQSLLPGVTLLPLPNVTTVTNRTTT